VTKLYFDENDFSFRTNHPCFGGGWGEEKLEKLVFENFLKITIDSLIFLFAKIVKEPHFLNQRNTDIPVRAHEMQIEMSVLRSSPLIFFA